MDLWGSLWGDEVTPGELQRNCMGCFATQEATERKLTGKHFLCKDTVECEDFFFFKDLAGEQKSLWCPSSCSV